MSNLYVLGNGFDLSHGLPTSYCPHLRDLAIEREIFPDEWQGYSIGADLWSSVEEHLAHPDIDPILEHLDGYPPDLSSDRESDRDTIIHVAELLLDFPLEQFAERADEKLESTNPNATFVSLFQPDDHYLTFNYTHTLEHLYGIPSSQILHLHGEVGATPLIIGYEPGALKRIPALDEYDDENNYEHYRSEAYRAIKRRLAAFEKVYQHTSLSAFMHRIPHAPDRIVVIGHSLGRVDKTYFLSLVAQFPQARWTVHAHAESNLETMRAAAEAYELGVPYDLRVLLA